MPERQLSLESLLDKLTAQTARGFEEEISRPVHHGHSSSPVPPLTIRMVLDGKQLTNDMEDVNSWDFAIGNNGIRLHVKLNCENNTNRSLFLSSVAPEQTEWSMMTQMRIHAGPDESRSRIVDRDIFCFERFWEQVQFHLSPEINYIKFELRLVHLFVRPHPSLSEGDATIRFADGSTVKTWRALLALVSPYMAKCVSGASDTGEPLEVDVSPFDKPAFVELLLQLLPTQRPIGIKFTKLAHAAVSFDVHPLINRLSEYLVNLRKVPLHKRLADAAQFKLYSALSTMVEDAARREVWTVMIHNGFDPVAEFGEEVYTNVVCPAVIRSQYAPSLLPPPSLPSDASFIPNILGPIAASNPLNVRIAFLGTHFYVNSGVLASHGGSNMAVDENGVRQATATKKLLTVCGEYAIAPGEVLFSLLTSLYPFSRSVPVCLSHPALILASDLGLPYAVEAIEQVLISMPVTTPSQFISHLELAETYNLPNLMRATALRAEGSCSSLMKVVVVDERFATLLPGTRQVIVDRMCNGWAKSYPPLGIRMSTDRIDRKLRLDRCGPSPLASDQATFRSIASDDVFGEPEPVAVE